MNTTIVKILSLIICYISGLKTLTAQNIAISGNSKLLAVNNGGESKSGINIYQMNSLKWVRHFKFNQPVQHSVDDIQLNYCGKILYARKQNTSAVWNILTGSKVLESNNIQNIALARYDNFFALIKNGKLKLYDSFTGEELMLPFKLPDDLEIVHLQFSDNDKYIVAQSIDNDLIVWETTTAKLVHRISAFDYIFNCNGKYLTVLSAKGNNIHVIRYKTPDFKEIMRINCREEIKKHKKLNAGGTIASIPHHSVTPISIHSSFSQISPCGQYVVVVSGDKHKTNALNIINIEKQKVISAISKNTMRYPVNLYPYFWDKNNLIIRFSNHTSGIYNVASKRFVNPLNYNFEFGLFEKKMPDIELLKKRRISPNQRYAIVQKQGHSETVLFARAANIEQKKSKIDDVLFLGYDLNSDYIIGINNKNKIVKINTLEIEAGNEKPPVQQFSDTLTIPPDEKEILEDAVPPPGYDYIPVKQFAHISEISDNDTINLQLHTISADSLLAQISVHLLDQNGTYYYGASEDEWLHIWKKLEVKPPHVDKKQIRDFEVTEVKKDAGSSHAIAIILDHSGSMGSKRAYRLQKAAYDFIESKQENEAIAIVKYDSKIGIDASFSTDKNYLLQELGINGMAGYGGATALLDAMDCAITILKKYKKYERKSVLILTDGNENASLTTKNSVLMQAIKNNVRINTIGFGDYVSDKYLKSIAYMTQGSYHQIYGSKSFDWLFDNIRNRLQYYYNITFDIDSVGEYEAFMNVALNEIRCDTMHVAFDNTFIDLAEYDDFVEFLHPAIVRADTIETKNQTEIVQLPSVYFSFYQTMLIDRTEGNITTVVKYLRDHPNTIVEIQGHTDNIGDPRYNRRLSKLRAIKVKNMLVKREIHPDRIVTRGFGSSKPVASNSTETGRQKNRRVDFYIKVK